MRRRMYHILYDLETRFKSLKELENWVVSLRYLEPKVPRTAMETENRTVQRVCACPTLEGCFNAVKLTGVFRRCIYTNDEGDCLKDYENVHEVYPIVVLYIEGDFERPSVSEVPDVNVTDEHWATEACPIIERAILWMGHHTVECYENDDIGTLVCSKVHPVKNLNGKHHPWLDGKGHPLICSMMANEPWLEPVQPTVAGMLYYDRGLGRGSVVFAQPEWPLTGYCTCTDVLTGEQYRGVLQDLMQFTGYYDKHGEPLFVRDWAGYDLAEGTTKRVGFDVYLDAQGGLSLYCGCPEVRYGLNYLTVQDRCILDVHSNEHRGFAQKYSKIWDALKPIPEKSSAGISRMNLGG